MSKTLKTPFSILIHLNEAEDNLVIFALRQVWQSATFFLRFSYYIMDRLFSLVSFLGKKRKNSRLMKASRQCFYICFNFSTQLMQMVLIGFSMAFTLTLHLAFADVQFLFRLMLSYPGSKLQITENRMLYRHS